MIPFKNPKEDAAATVAKLWEEQARRQLAQTELQKEQNRLREAERYREKFHSYFPETGPLRRELYKPHLNFFEAGATYRERAFIAGNRTGKTSAAAYETAAHLTGLYPKWWTGKRFTRPTKGWAAGTTNGTTRDIIQQELLGRIRRKGNEDTVTGLGTGMILGSKILDTRPRAGIPDAVEIVYVRHASGGSSQLTLKSYEQGREAFEGGAIDFAWLDEEPGEDVYIECVMRTMTTGGICMLTFTPLLGLSTVVLKFLPGGQFPQNGIVLD